MDKKKIILLNKKEPNNNYQTVRRNHLLNID